MKKVEEGLEEMIKDLFGYHSYCVQNGIFNGELFQDEKNDFEDKDVEVISFGRNISTKKTEKQDGKVGERARDIGNKIRVTNLRVSERKETGAGGTTRGRKRTSNRQGHGFELGIHDRLKYVSGKHANMFNQMKSIKFMIFIFVPIIIACIFDCLTVRQDSLIIRNLVKVYCDSLDLTNHFEYIKESVILAGYYGSNYRKRKNDNFLEVFKQEIDEVEVLAQGLESNRKENLGIFQAEYEFLFTKSNLCDDLVSRDYYNITKCGVGAGIVFSNDIGLALKYSISICKEALDQAIYNKEKGETFENLRDYWSNSKIKAFLGATSRSTFSSNIAYMILGPLVVHLQKYLLSNELKRVTSKTTLWITLELLNTARLFLGFSICYMMVSLPILYIFVVKQFSRNFTIFYRTPNLLPISLIKNNPLLSHHFNN